MKNTLEILGTKIEGLTEELMDAKTVEERMILQARLEKVRANYNEIKEDMR